MVRGTRHTSRRKTNPTTHSAISGPMRALELAFKEADVRKAEVFRRGILSESPTFVEHGPLRILVSASPTDATLASYINTLAMHNVTHVVRVCEPFYDSSRLRHSGLQTHDWVFPDGEAPPPSVVHSWLALLDVVFNLRSFTNRCTSAADPFACASPTNNTNSNPNPATSSSASSSPTAVHHADVDAYESDVTQSPASSADMHKQTVAIHCAAGLGRAPALVALALVEIGLHPMEAVTWLRGLRRGAINGTQLAFLHEYQPRPPPSPPKPERTHARSPFMFWPALRSARAFRCRTPSVERAAVVDNSSSAESRSSSSPRSASRRSASHARRPKPTDVRFS